MGARSAFAPVCTAAGDRIGSRAASDAAIAEARVARNAEWDAARGIWSLYDVEAASESDADLGAAVGRIGNDCLEIAARKTGASGVAFGTLTASLSVRADLS